ncbi:hypothetical protein [Shewanella algae]
MNNKYRAPASKCNGLPKGLKLLVPFMLLISTPCTKAHAADWYCFVSQDEPHPIYLAFSFSDEESKESLVWYKNSSDVIKLEQTSLEGIEITEGRPYEYTYKYLEKIDGITSGNYTIVVQGANFYRFEYKPKNKNKVYEFNMDPESQLDDTCVWQ